jgi:ribonuclease HI
VCPHLRGAEEVEAKATLMGIKSIQGMGYSKIILEVDCSVVVSALRARGPDRSKNWFTIDETKKMLKEMFAFRSEHTRRGSNKVATPLLRWQDQQGATSGCHGSICSCYIKKYFKALKI